MDVNIFIGWVVRIASLGSFISWLEFLANHRQLQNENLLSWEVSKLRHRSFTSKLFTFILDPILAYPNVLILVFTGLMSSLIMLTIAPNGIIGMIILFCLAVSHILLFIRSPQGQDGADQMNILIFITIFLAHLCTSIFVKELCIIFLALQLCLSYTTAGVAKAISPLWRSGDALIYIFRTRIYGNRHLAYFFNSNRRAARLVSLLGIIFEVMFPLVIFIPQPFNYFFLSFGIVFHMSTAIFMGLNTFFWAFMAPYPAVIYTSFLLQRHLCKLTL